MADMRYVLTVYDKKTDNFVEEIGPFTYYSDVKAFLNTDKANNLFDKDTEYMKITVKEFNEHDGEYQPVADYDI